MPGSVASLDPREFPAEPAQAATAEHVGALLYDRLVVLDENGQPQSALAESWQHDAAFKRWQFRLRRNVKFQDGTPLTQSIVAAWWQRLNGTERLAGVAGEWVWIETEQAMPNFLIDLAQGRNFVFHITTEGNVTGTGPFRVSEWQTGRKLVLTANDEYWGGRPFLDGISVQMGVNSSQQVLDLELGRADVVDVAPELARRVTRSARRLWSSAPLKLLALVFDASRPVAADARLRQALALSIDRASIVNVLLQKQGETAGGLLPQWLSGYAFLFDTARDVNRAREIVQAIAPPLKTLTLAYEPGDLLTRAVAERVALNAGDAGITVRPVAGGIVGSADVKLMRLRLASLSPSRALTAVRNAAGMQATIPQNATDEPEQLYAVERTLLGGELIVPLAHISDTVGLGARVRNWMPLRWGEWRLADVWLESDAGAAGNGMKP